MDLQGLKLHALGIDKAKLGKVFTFVDFGNVNRWYERDRRNAEGNELGPTQRLVVSIPKLAEFLDLFSAERRFYYGWHKRMKQSWHILVLAERSGFVKVTKPIQYIHHYLEGIEVRSSSQDLIKEDRRGKYFEVSKCNFDVEISVDSIRLIDRYDTFCLLSGDSDFARLAKYLKSRRKKIVVVASGQVFYTLREMADVYVRAQDIKGSILTIKETPPR